MKTADKIWVTSFFKKSLNRRQRQNQTASELFVKKKTVKKKIVKEELKINKCVLVCLNLK